MSGEHTGRIREMIRKEFLHVRRDHRLWRLLFIAPLIQLMIFGYAVSTDVRNTATVVVDLSHTQEARDLIDAFTASGYFRIVARSTRPADAVQALDHGDALAALVIPVDFATALGQGHATVQLLLDGTQSNSATVAQGYAERIVQEYAIAAAGNIRLAIDLRARAWFNPDLLSRNYNVPAVAGTIVFLMSLILTALAVVREREIGTLEQLMVSPLTPFELIGGKTIPFALFAFVDVLLVTGAALFWFGVPFVGSLWQLMLASLLFILSGLGVGLLISTVSKTQQQAFLTTFLVFMPIMLLSGFMFPVNSMPKIFQWLTLVNPMRHYLEIVRSIFLKGAGIAPLWHQYAVLAVLGIVTLIFAASRFRKVAG
jgi:ABC-2 type transport system permease protein